MGKQSFNGLGGIENKVTKLTNKKGPNSILIINQAGLTVCSVSQGTPEQEKKAAFGAALTSEIIKYSLNYANNIPDKSILYYEDYKLMIQLFEPFIVISEWEKDNNQTGDFEKGINGIIEELIEELT